MTEHPLIPLSVMLSKLLLNQPSAFVPPEEVLQMKGGWKGDYGMFIHYRNPHQQDVLTVNERRKEETDFYLKGRLT